MPNQHDKDKKMMGAYLSSKDRSLLRHVVSVIGITIADFFRISIRLAAKNPDLFKREKDGEE